MKNLKIILALMLIGCLSARAVNIVTGTLTITDNPVNTSTVTIGGYLFTWTNGTPVGTQAILITNTFGGDATNLLNVAGPVVPFGGIVLTNVSSNVVAFTGIGLTASVSAAWATLTFSTNSTTGGTNVIVPIGNYPSGVRASVESQLVTDIGTYSGVALDMTSVAASQLVGTNNNQIIGGNKTFQGTLNGTVGNLTNGGWLNGSLTNGQNFGNPFRSPGAQLLSEQFGSSALATGTEANAFGSTSVATSNGACAFGAEAQAIGVGSLAIGYQSGTTGQATIAIGNSASATGLNTLALGAGSSVSQTNSVALGFDAVATASHQIMLGTSAEFVQFPGGVLFTGNETNAVLTGTNQVAGQLAFTRTNNTSLANSNNVVDPLSKTYIKVSGPTGAFCISTITRGVDGRVLMIQNSTGQTMVVQNEAGYGSVGDRILTGTGADTNVVNNPGFITLIYDSAISRWILTSQTH